MEQIAIKEALIRKQIINQPRFQTKTFDLSGSFNKVKKKKTFWDGIKTEPYRVFFPLGWAGAMWGASVWALFYLNIVAYPGLSHKIGMIHVFLLSYIIGFLFTAIPRFTATVNAKTEELILGLGSVFLVFVSLFFENDLVYNLGSKFLWLGTFTGLSTLFYFLVRRFKTKKQKPPSSFIFIGSALFLSWLLCSIQVINLFVFNNSFSPSWSIFLNNWFYFNFIISLIIGVGSKLIPAITGWTQIQAPEDLKKSQKRFGYYALFFYLTFLFHHIFNYLNSHSVAINHTLFGALKASLLTIIAFREWNIFKRPASRTYVSWGLWLSAWSITAGEWLTTFFFNWKMHFEHLTLVSGFLLITLIVGTRVGIAHGGYDLQIEKTSKRILALIALVFLAAITRVSAGFLGERYNSHLFYAALTLIAALILWGTLMLPKYGRPNNN